MARVKPVRRPADYRGDPAEAAALFDALFPGAADPAFDADHDGMAIAALNPRLALTLARASRFMALDLDWCARADLRELAIHAVNLHYRSTYAMRSRRAAAHAAGLTDAMLDALPGWRDSGLFDADQGLVVDYATAVPSGDVPEELFAAMAGRFGEKGAVECTAVISFWAFWAMFLNSLRPDAA